MSSEILPVPESCLKEVIAVIRAGLKSVKVGKETKRGLTEWCKDEEEYLKRLEEE